jgi:hypothetical protein
LRWLIFTRLCVFAFVLLWRFGLIRQTPCWPAEA